MTVTLLDAAAAFAAREQAAGWQAVLGEDEIRRLYIGFDIDINELATIAQAEAALSTSLLAIYGQDELLAVMRSLYMTGLATGLLLADMRAREQAHTATCKGS